MVREDEKSAMRRETKKTNTRRWRTKLKSSEKTQSASKLETRHASPIDEEAVPKGPWYEVGEEEASTMRGETKSAIGDGEQ